MNKYITLVIIIHCVFVSFVDAQEEDPIRDFAAAVNSAWMSTNYVQLLQVIDDRLAQDTNDLLALCVKQSYYLNCDFDISQAHTIAHAITNSVVQSGITNLLPLVEVKTDLVLSTPTNIVASYTPEKIANLHQEFYDMFPGLIEAIDIALEYEVANTNSP